MDPRVKTSPAALQQQFALSKQIADALRRDMDALQEVRAMRAQARTRGDAALEQRIAAFEGQGGRGGGGGGGPSFAGLNGELASLYNIIEGADVAPTTQAVAAVRDRLAALDTLLTRWREVRASIR
jgi:hypothetical protein